MFYIFDKINSAGKTEAERMGHRSAVWKNFSPVIEAIEAAFL